jgi:hypothetical protein
LGEDLEETVLQFDLSTRQLSLGRTKIDADRTNSELAIVEFLQEAGEPQTQVQVRKGVEGQTRIVRAALTALATQGTITKTGDGTRGRPFLYGFQNTGSTAYSETREPESLKPAEPHGNSEDFVVPKDGNIVISFPTSSEPETVFEEGEL